MLPIAHFIKFVRFFLGGTIQESSKNTHAHSRSSEVDAIALERLNSAMGSAHTYSHKQISFLYQHIKNHIQEQRETAIKEQRTIKIEPCSSLCRLIMINHRGTVRVIFNKKEDILIGKGSFKQVFPAWNHTRRIWEAVYQMTNGTEATRELKRATWVKEIDGFIRIKSDTLFPLLVTKWYRRGELYDQVDRLTDIEKAAITRQLISSVRELHRRGMLHRDLKPENVFLEGQGETIKAVIGDLNSIGVIDGKRKKIRYYTSLDILSPEYAKGMLKGDLTASLTRASEVWALGLILYFMYINPMYPWLSQDKASMALAPDKISKLEETWFPEPKNMSSIEHLIWSLLQIDPKKRPTMEQVARTYNQMTLS